MQKKNAKYTWFCWVLLRERGLTIQTMSCPPVVNLSGHNIAYSVKGQNVLDLGLYMHNHLAHLTHSFTVYASSDQQIYL